MKKIILMFVMCMIVFAGCGDKENIDTSNDIFVESNINNDSKKNNIIEKDEEENMKIIENEYDTFYLSNNGDVYAKGLNECGELGLGHNKKVEEKTKIEGLKDITKIILGQNESRVFVYFIDKNGEVYASGYNADGQLALGHTNNVLVPTKISNISNVKDIETSQYLDCNTYFLTNEGQVYVSGANRKGELGVGHNNKVLVPTRVLTGIKAKQVVYGDMFGYTMYLSEDGEVYVSGYNVHPESTKDVYQINYCEKVGDLEGIKIVEINADDLVEHICVADNGQNYIIDNRGNGPVAMKKSDENEYIVLYNGYEMTKECKRQTNTGYKVHNDDKFNCTYYNYENGEYVGESEGKWINHDTFQDVYLVSNVSKMAISGNYNAIPRKIETLNTLPNILSDREELSSNQKVKTSIVDLDGNGTKEIIVATVDWTSAHIKSDITLYDSNGDKVASIVYMDEEGYFSENGLLNSVEVIDIDNDGIMEIIADVPCYELQSGYEITVLKYDGEKLIGEYDIDYIGA